MYMSYVIYVYIYIFVIAIYIYIYVCLLYISFNILYESTIDLSTLIQCVHICRKFAPTRQSVQSSVAKALSQQLGAGKGFALPCLAHRLRWPFTSFLPQTGSECPISSGSVLFDP